jgi:hypothetical protein
VVVCVHKVGGLPNGSRINCGDFLVPAQPYVP